MEVNDFEILLLFSMFKMWYKVWYANKQNETRASSVTLNSLVEGAIMDIFGVAILDFTHT